MSISKWRWTHECDERICPGSCDYCDMPYKSELDKLEGYLRKNNIDYERIEEPNVINIDGYECDYGRHQIIVYNTKNKILFDAICQRGSYGFEDGLLEVMGSAVVDRAKDGDSVAGWLTAEQVIERFERNKH